MVAKNSFNINALTNNDDRYWRIDWFGYLRYFDRHGQKRSEPLVDVFLSPFEKTPDKASVNYKSSTKFDLPNVARVPVSYLRVLRLGDVWRHGRRVHLGHYEMMRERFDDLVIDSETTTTMQAGSKDKMGEYIVPFSHHPYHGKATQIYCEVINLPNGNIVVVPHYVILQAYFSSSQYVFQQLFKFGLQFESIYDPYESYIEPDGSAYISLKKWTHDVAAAEVARMAFCPHARKAVSRISMNLALQQVNQETIRPKSAFPFEGRTNLDVYGKWCPLGNSKREVFVVYDILGCTAPYPFSSLEYFRENPGDLGPEDTTSKPDWNDTSGYNKPKPKPPSDGDTELQPDEETTNTLEELELAGRRGTQFSDLLEKEIEKKRQKPHKEKGSRRHQQSTEEISVGNTGEGDLNGMVAPVDIQLPEGEFKDKYVFDNRICRLTLFLELIGSIRSMSRVTNVEFVQVFPELGDGKGIYSFFPKTYTMSGRTSTWQYINYVKGITQLDSTKYQHRRAIIAKITVIDDFEVYLIETERRTCAVDNGWVELDSTSLFLAVSGAQDPISNYQLSQLVEDCSDNRGTWDLNLLGISVKSFSIKHVSNTSILSENHLVRQVALFEKYMGFKFG